MAFTTFFTVLTVALMGFATKLFTAPVTAALPFCKSERTLIPLGSIKFTGSF